MEIRGKYFILNGKQEPAEVFQQLSAIEGPTLYEVFRIINGIPLFVEDHILRFENSAGLAGLVLPYTRDDIFRHVTILIRANRFRNANIKLIACYPSGKPPCYAAYFVEHQYPKPSEFRLGVDTITLRAVRQNPNAKIFHTALREETNKLKRNLNVYEVLLVDNNGNITEGSRSNFFCIRGNQVITPPVHEVLPGVTRKYVLQACHNLKCPVSETSVPAGDLPSMEALFLTGTSRKILPIRKVDGGSFSVSHPMMRALMEEFGRIVDDYLSRHDKL